MTNQALPQMANWTLEDQFAYLMALIFAREPRNPKLALELLKRFNLRLAKEMGTVIEALLDSSGLPTPSPAEQLTFWYNKPETMEEAMQRNALPPDDPMFMPAPHSWESFRARLPKRYIKAWDRFQALRKRAYDGELGPELQMREVMARASAGLAPVLPQRPVLGAS